MGAMFHRLEFQDCIERRKHPDSGGHETKYFLGLPLYPAPPTTMDYIFPDTKPK